MAELKIITIIKERQDKDYRLIITTNHMFQAGGSAPKDLATATQVTRSYMPIFHELVQVTEEKKSFNTYPNLCRKYIRTCVILVLD